MVFRSIYGVSGSISETLSSGSTLSPWSGVLEATSQFKAKGVDLLLGRKRLLGDCHSLSFWNDLSMGDRYFKLRFDRVYRLDDDRQCSFA